MASSAAVFARSAKKANLDRSAVLCPPKPHAIHSFTPERDTIHPKHGPDSNLSQAVLQLQLAEVPGSPRTPKRKATLSAASPTFPPPG